MKNLEDKLAASIKPARSKSPAQTKSPATAGEQAQGQTPARASVEQKQVAARKKLPAPQQGKEAPGSDVADLNGPAQPLHPKRIWPD